MSGTHYDVLAYDPREGTEHRLRVRARTQRLAIRLVEGRGLEVVDVDGGIVRRPDGGNVPWIGLFAIAGVLVTALASVALGFVENDVRKPVPNAAAAVDPPVDAAAH